ncbi:MAG: type II toxin-antitoxin system prevent-host-death family antitoxin [Spirochaetaceae bacterium]|nr:MAG: type II toxin-antitoxin system prevent-host-death family antitoxin [Spirochaetaceae bacterium]
MGTERKVAIAELKAHLSAEIRRVRNGEQITILDHRKPVARLTGIEDGPRYLSRARTPFVWREYEPLISSASLPGIVESERADSW